MQSPKFDITPYINLAWRRKWWIIIPFILSTLGGTVWLGICPKTYKASTLILLEPQSIPDSFVRSTVTETMEGRLRTITQQIHSRTNLEQIIKDFQLDQRSNTSRKGAIIQTLIGYFPALAKILPSRQQRPNSEQAFMMSLVNELKSGLQVTMRSGGSGGGGRDQTAAFEISFEWLDQDLVAPITNAVAARFIEQNLNLREEMAISTTDFLDQETAAIRNELEGHEKELEAFRKEHMGMLPEQLEANINTLNQLREEQTNLERRLEQEKQQALLIKSQAQLARSEREALASALRQDQGNTGSARRDTRMTMDQLTGGSLEELEAELSRLSAIYTEKHPDIVALKRRIEALRAEGSRSRDTSAQSATQDSSLNRVALQLIPINANIESYKRQIQDVEKQIQVYKERVERTPQLELAMNKIQRDYQTVRQRYESLLTRKLDAKLAEQLEKRKKGEQFRILDPAVKPPRPFKPDAKRIVLIALAAGLGLGCGMAYLRESLDPCFYSPDELEAFLETRVLVSIPFEDPKSHSKA